MPSAILKGSICISCQMWEIVSPAQESRCDNSLLFPRYEPLLDPDPAALPNPVPLGPRTAQAGTAVSSPARRGPPFPPPQTRSPPSSFHSRAQLPWDRHFHERPHRSRLGFPGRLHTAPVRPGVLATRRVSVLTVTECARQTAQTPVAEPVFPPVKCREGQSGRPRLKAQVRGVLHLSEWLRAGNRAVLRLWRAAGTGTALCPGWTPRGGQMPTRGAHTRHVTQLPTRGAYTRHVTQLPTQGAHTRHVTQLPTRGADTQHVTQLPTRGADTRHVTQLLTPRFQPRELSVPMVINPCADAYAGLCA